MHYPEPLCMSKCSQQMQAHLCIQVHIYIQHTPNIRSIVLSVEFQTEQQNLPLPQNFHILALCRIGNCTKFVQSCLYFQSSQCCLFCPRHLHISHQYWNFEVQWMDGLGCKTRSYQLNLLHAEEDRLRKLLKTYITLPLEHCVHFSTHSAVICLCYISESVLAKFCMELLVGYRNVICV